MSRRRALGKGLDALIPGGPEVERDAAGVQDVPLDQIQANPRQPRAGIDPVELEGLAASIGEHGLLQPLIVSHSSAGTGYTLIAGQRRLEAARLAGLLSVPVIIRQAGDRERLEMALVENLQRTDLNALEAAEGYRQLTEDFGLTHEAIAQRLGKSRSAVSNALRLLNLASEVQEALSGGAITEGHARALLGLSEWELQVALLKTVLRRGLNVRQAEALVKRSASKARPKASKAKSPEELDLENRLESTLGTRVRIRRGRRGGQLAIDFYSDEELNAIADRLLGEESAS